MLDVGRASGHMAAELKKRGCVVRGVEIDHSAAEKARGVCASVVEGGMDEVKRLPFADAMFDCILALDVLEHMRRPDRTLTVLRPLLKPDGFLLCSIPNVACFEVRI